jgi:hypothetical protein
MNYQRIYDEFIANRLSKYPFKGRRKGRELHHIVPRILGGSNSTPNLISLTYSDHLFAHLLLAKIHRGKLSFAFWSMRKLARYQGRHTRLEHADLRAESNIVKGNTRRGTPHTSKQDEAIRAANARRRGQPVHPALAAGAKRYQDYVRGKPAHPKALEAVSRRGDQRSAAQKERDVRALEIARSNITKESIASMIAKKTGVPWSPARRAAQFKKSIEFIA